jgi:hypothetical protein
VWHSIHVRRAALIAVLVLASCTSLQNVQMFAIEECDTLYFGTQKPDGGVVTDAEWQQFLADVVTPRFPDGFTTWEANGQWRDRKGVIEHERTHILQIVTPSETKIREIVEAYKRQFAQESVLRLHTHVGVPMRSQFTPSGGGGRVVARSQSSAHPAVPSAHAVHESTACIAML